MILQWTALMCAALCGCGPDHPSGVICTTVTNDSEASTVQAAIDAAAAGATICLPETTVRWLTPIHIAKPITLAGAGVGATIVEDGVQQGSLIDVALVDGETTRITGLELRDGGRAEQFSGATITAVGTEADTGRLRVDHCKFDHLNSYPNVASHRAYGVIDHSEFGYTPTHRAINVHGMLTNDDVRASDDAWAAPPAFGSERFLFIEDNTFAYDDGNFYAHVDCFDAGRFVFRHNTVYRGWVECHGTDSTGRNRGGRAVEVYDNHFISTDGLGTTVTNARSGTWIVHDNTMSGYTYGTGGPGLQLNAYRNVGSNAPFAGADGTNPWDKNTLGGPFASGIATAVGTRTLSVAGTGWTSGQWKGYSVRKTSAAATCTSLVHDGAPGYPVATATCNAHGLAVGDLVQIRGADQLAYNQQSRVDSVPDANTFSFKLFWGAAPAPGSGTIRARKGQDYAHVLDNTTDTITFAPGAFVDLAFTVGDTFELWRVMESMDQPCNGQGSQLGGAFDPPLPAGWNDQIVEGCYEWNNVQGAMNVDFTVPYPQLQPGVHYFTDAQPAGYSTYPYPNPLAAP